MVDLPMPGSPPSKTRDPFTIPPPRTLSSSFEPVKYLCSSSVEISFILKGLEYDEDIRFSGLTTPDLVVSRISSLRVFHSPQDGHFPSHFAVS